MYSEPYLGGANLHNRVEYSMWGREGDFFEQPYELDT